MKTLPLLCRLSTGFALAEEPGDAAEAKLTEIVLKEFKIQDCSPVEALDYFRSQATEVTDKKLSPNFILRSGISETTGLPLNLRNIPAPETLRNLREMARIKTEFEKHAIVVSPL